MRWFTSFFRALFGFRRNSANRRHLMGMYFNESNASGLRKNYRERS